MVGDEYSEQRKDSSGGGVFGDRCDEGERAIES